MIYDEESKELSISLLKWILYDTNIVISQNDKEFFWEDYETKIPITSSDIFDKFISERN